MRWDDGSSPLPQSRQHQWPLLWHLLLTFVAPFRGMIEMPKLRSAMWLRPLPIGSFRVLNDATVATSPLNSQPDSLRFNSHPQLDPPRFSSDLSDVNHFQIDAYSNYLHR